MSFRRVMEAVNEGPRLLKGKWADALGETLAALAECSHEGFPRYCPACGAVRGLWRVDREPAPNVACACPDGLRMRLPPTQPNVG